MLLLRNGMVANVCENTCTEDEGSSDSGEVCIKDERIQGTPGSLGTSPYVAGDLQIISLGNSFFVVFVFLFYIIKSVASCIKRFDIFDCTCGLMKFLPFRKNCEGF